MSDMITDPKPPQSPQLFDDATVAEFNTAQLDTVQSDTAQLNRAQTVLRGFQQQNADQLLEGLNPQQQQAVRPGQVLEKLPFLHDVLPMYWQLNRYGHRKF